MCFCVRLDILFLIKDYLLYFNKLTSYLNLRLLIRQVLLPSSFQMLSHTVLKFQGMLIALRALHNN